MSISLSRALEWRPSEVHLSITTLHELVTVASNVTSRLKAESDRGLDGVHGNFIDTASDSIAELHRYVSNLHADLEEITELLASFATDASNVQQRLHTAVDAAHALGGVVAENGVVKPPAGAEPPSPTEFASLEGEIKRALTELDALDSSTASTLESIHNSIADYRGNWDPRTAAAGGVVSGLLDPLKPLIGDDGFRSTRNIAKLLGPFGNVLGLGMGFAGAPEDESATETAVAEIGGAAAGVAGTVAGAAATGFVLGSFVPGVGNVAGAVIGAGVGAVAGAASSWAASSMIRDAYDYQRQEG